jgi:hypothetical protein
MLPRRFSACASRLCRHDERLRVRAERRLTALARERPGQRRLDRQRIGATLDDFVEHRIAADESGREVARRDTHDLFRHDLDRHVAEPRVLEHRSNRGRIVESERRAIEQRRIGGEERCECLIGDATERVPSERVPDVEAIPTAMLQHTLRFARAGRLVREEHHAELTHDLVELARFERQRGAVGGTPFEARRLPHRLPSHLDHRGIEIGRDHAHVRRSALE